MSEEQEKEQSTTTVQKLIAVVRKKFEELDQTVLECLAVVTVSLAA